MGSAITTFGAAIGAVVAVAGILGPLEANAGAGRDHVVRPAHGLVLDVGSKHTVSYFTAERARCNLTVVVGEKAGEDAYGSVGARVSVAVDGGRTARVDTADGKSLEYGCAADASSMRVRAVQIVAHADAK